MTVVQQIQALISNKAWINLQKKDFQVVFWIKGAKYNGLNSQKYVPPINFN